MGLIVILGFFLCLAAWENAKTNNKSRNTNEKGMVLGVLFLALIFFALAG